MHLHLPDVLPLDASTADPVAAPAVVVSSSVPLLAELLLDGPVEMDTVPPLELPGPAPNTSRTPADPVALPTLKDKLPDADVLALPVANNSDPVPPLPLDPDWAVSAPEVPDPAVMSPDATMVEPEPGVQASATHITPHWLHMTHGVSANTRPHLARLHLWTAPRCRTSLRLLQRCQSPQQHRHWCCWTAPRY